MVINTKFGPGDKFWTIYEGKATQFTCDFMSVDIKQDGKIEITVFKKENTPRDFYPKERFCFNTKEELLSYI